jgi:hypothetical protein
MNQAGQEFDKRNCNGAIKVGGKIEKYKVQNTSRKTDRQTDRRAESVAIEEIVERCQVSRMQCITTLQWRVWQEEKLEGWG